MKITFDPADPAEVKLVRQLLDQTPPEAEPEVEPEPEPRRRQKRTKPVLLGKRSANLGKVPCLHRTTTTDDICLQCGEYAPDEKSNVIPHPTAQVERVLKRFEGKFPQPFDPVVIMPSPNQHTHLRVARFVAGRKRPLVATNIAAHLHLDTVAVAASMQMLKRLGLVEQPRGEYTHHWVSTAKLRNRGVVAA